VKLPVRLHSKGKLIALPTKIELGWECQAVTNTQLTILEQKELYYRSLEFVPISIKNCF
jgi:hypothetical protein